MKRRGLRGWEIGVFAQDDIEYGIFLLHEYGGYIDVTRKMQKWWIREFGKSLTVSHITINELRVIRNVLEQEPHFEHPGI
jgi:hypothetical protein